jgi:isopentenyl diphosphate isomerase/L-lactate dehydrogenase-like FMN-dependent dehydrogenase
MLTIDPWKTKNGGQQFDPTLNWNDVEWVKKRWGGKLIPKGVQDVEDARLAVQSGADALIVSNHGGRQLDCAESSIRALLSRRLKRWPCIFKPWTSSGSPSGLWASC